MSPDVKLSNGQTFHVERAIAGFNSLYVAGEQDAVNAITEAKSVLSVTLTEDEKETPEVLTRDAENVRNVVFSKDKPPTVHILEKKVA